MAKGSGGGGRGGGAATRAYNSYRRALSFYGSVRGSSDKALVSSASRRLERSFNRMRAARSGG